MSKTARPHTCVATKAAYQGTLFYSVFRCTVRYGSGNSYHYRTQANEPKRLNCHKKRAHARHEPGKIGINNYDHLHAHRPGKSLALSCYRRRRSRASRPIMCIKSSPLLATAAAAAITAPLQSRHCPPSCAQTASPRRLDEQLVDEPHLALGPHVLGELESDRDALARGRLEANLLQRALAVERELKLLEVLDGDPLE